MCLWWDPEWHWVDFRWSWVVRASAHGARREQGRLVEVSPGRDDVNRSRRGQNRPQGQWSCDLIFIKKESLASYQ